MSEKLKVIKIHVGGYADCNALGRMATRRKKQGWTVVPDFAHKKAKQALSPETAAGHRVVLNGGFVGTCLRILIERAFKVTNESITVPLHFTRANDVRNAIFQDSIAYRADKLACSLPDEIAQSPRLVVTPRREWPEALARKAKWKDKSTKTR